MKFLLVTQYFNPENLPINFVSKLLLDNGYSHDIITGKPNYPQGKFYKGFGLFSRIKYVENQQVIYRLPILPRGKSKNFRGLKLFFNYLSFVISGCIFSPIALYKHEYKFIFVYANSPLLKVLPAILISKLKRIPLIIWVQDLWPESVFSTGIKFPRLFMPTLKLLVKFIYKNADLIACQSKSFMKDISLNYPLEENKLFYLPNTINEDGSMIFEKESSEIDSLFSEEKINIVFTGNIGFAQRLDQVIIALSKLSTTKIYLHLVGSGSAVDSLKALCRSHKLSNVFFHGSYPAISMAHFYNNADFLLISLGNEDIYTKTIPNKLQGYLASKKPIFGVLAGEAAEIISQNKCGIVASPDSIHDITQKLNDLESINATELSEMSSRSYKIYDAYFSNQRFITSFNKMIRRINSKTS